MLDVTKGVDGQFSKLSTFLVNRKLYVMTTMFGEGVNGRMGKGMGGWGILGISSITTRKPPPIIA